MITWGETARESYERMIEIVDAAERFAAARAKTPLRVRTSTPLDLARQRAALLAPILRGLLAEPSGDADRPFRRCIVRPLVERAALDFVDADGARERALSPTVTSDHLIRTKALPVFVDAPAWDDAARLRDQVATAVDASADAYRAYVERHRARLPEGVAAVDAKPRVVLVPGLGALCA
ncbi:MAG: bifunctional aldolase/short-chain dehydrogenase, partial [Myxococcota bacterium]|nr:bifunctional aldolase/short-chain dehydrogenase [Myxococcota bacterium]